MSGEDDGVAYLVAQAYADGVEDGKLEGSLQAYADGVEDGKREGSLQAFAKGLDRGRLVYLQAQARWQATYWKAFLSGVFCGACLMYGWAAFK